MVKLKLSTKLNILNELKSTKATELALKYDVTKAAITKIKKHQHLKQLTTGNLTVDLNRYRVRNADLFIEIDKDITEFVNTCNTRGFPVSKKCIQLKARQLSLIKGIVGFKASDSWFYTMKKRCKLNYNKPRGENKSVDINTVNNFLSSELPTIISEFADYEIWNCDETGLQYKAIRQWSYFCENADKHGIKLSKKRISILLTVSQNGEKKRPLIIGPSARPHSFAEILYDTEQSSIDYYFNKKNLDDHYYLS